MNTDAYTAVADLPELHIERGDSVFYVQALKRGAVVPVLYVPMPIDRLQMALLILNGTLHPLSEEDMRGKKPGTVPPNLSAKTQPSPITAPPGNRRNSDRLACLLPPRED